MSNEKKAMEENNQKKAYQYNSPENEDLDLTSYDNFEEEGYDESLDFDDEDNSSSYDRIDQARELAKNELKKEAEEKAEQEAEKAVFEVVKDFVVSNPYVLLVLVVIIVIIFILGIIIAGPALEKSNNSTTTVTGGQLNLENPPDLGSPDVKGYYLLPKSSVYGGYYGGDYNCNKWGSKTLIGVLYTVAKAYSETGHSKMFIGDLNSSGHETHKTGIDADVDLPSAMLVDGGSYKREWAIDAAKLYFKTGTIRWIYYDDPVVNEEVNKWARENNLPGEMKAIGGHDNHFHIRIDLRYELSPFAPHCSGSSG